MQDHCGTDGRFHMKPLIDSPTAENREHFPNEAL